MNFGFTKWRIITPIICLVVLDFVIAMVLRCVPYNIKLVIGDCSPIFITMIEPFVIILSLLGVGGIYVVWSLVERK